MDAPSDASATTSVHQGRITRGASALVAARPPVRGDSVEDVDDSVHGAEDVVPLHGLPRPRSRNQYPVVPLHGLPRPRSRNQYPVVVGIVLAARGCQYPAHRGEPERGARPGRQERARAAQRPAARVRHFSVIDDEVPRLGTGGGAHHAEPGGTPRKPGGTPRRAGGTLRTHRTPLRTQRPRYARHAHRQSGGPAEGSARSAS